MTANRSLKRRVRERMTQTGERYAVARAALLGADAPALRAPGAPNHPEVWALSELLAGAGVESSQSFALGLSGGCGFLGMAFRYDAEDFTNLHVSGWNPFQSSIVTALERLGMLGELSQTGSERVAAQALARATAGGAPVAVWADAATLGLRPAALAGMSPVVLVVRGAGDGTLLVSDGSAAPAPVDADLLAAARGRIASQKRRMLVASGTPADEVLAEAVLDGLRARAAGVTGGPARGNSGPDGIAALARRIGARTGRDAWARVFDGERHIAGALASLADAVRREDGLLRRPMAAFVRAASGYLEVPELAQHADALEALAGLWDEVAALAAAGGPAALPDLAARVAAIAEREARAVAELAEVVIEVA